MQTWLPVLAVLAPIAAVLISALGLVSANRARKGQRQVRAAAATVQERAQQWTEMKDTVDALSRQVDLANNRLAGCLERETDHIEREGQRVRAIAELQRRVDELEATR